MSSHSNWSWEEMIAAFRALGGTIENIRRGSGPRGSGLFAIDNTSPVLLRIPENLFFPADEIAFVDGRIRLNDTAFVEQGEREFFDRYQESFAWGAGGRAEWAAYVAGLDTLPSEIRGLLGAEFGLAPWIEGDASERTNRLFLASRQIGWNERGVIMPLIDLANYGGGGLGYELGADLRIEGTVGDEVLISHGAHDAWSVLLNFGSTGPAPGAFSLPMKLSVGSNELTIGRDIDRSVQRGNYLVPAVVRAGSRVSLSHLMLGHAPYPSAPRGIFQALTKEIFGENTDEVFDTVRQFNARKFLHLLAALEPFDGPIVAKLEKAARFQLEAISWSIGSLDLYAPVPPPWRETEAQRRRSAPAKAEWNWERMLLAFRALGGEAENIRFAYGPSGRGILPIHRDRPFHLRVPQSLIFPVSDIVFDDGKIGIRAGAPSGDPERAFFARYEDGFSWGDGGQAESAEFVTGFQALPPDVREVLSAQFSMGDLLEGEVDVWTQKHFLQRRAIEWKGRAVLAPVAELVKHHPDADPYGGADFLEIAGENRDEAFVSYRSVDSFEFFRRFGFASSEPVAFAMPMKAKLGQFHLVVERDVPPHVTRGNFIKPKIWRDGDRVVVSCVPIGHRDFPKMSRGTFRGLLRSVDVAEDEADEAFDRVLHFNRTKFLKLLEVLAQHEGKVVDTLRKMARFQLEAMSWCIGSREG